MFKALKIILIAGCAVAGLSQNGMAADMDQPIFVEQAPELQPIEVGNGWYIRGDIGLNLAGQLRGPGFSFDLGGGELINFASSGGGNSQDINVNTLTVFGAGVGYQINDMFRVDATLDFLPKSSVSLAERLSVIPAVSPCKGYQIVLVNGNPVSQPKDITNCVEENSAELSAGYAMANAYVDLGTFVGWTPYVGAGVGVARLDWQAEVDKTICTPLNASQNAEGCTAIVPLQQPNINTPYTEPGTTIRGTDYYLAYSLGAGVAYELSKNLKLDVGYKYLSVASDTEINLDVHQAKIGVRYSLW